MRLKEYEKQDKITEAEFERDPYRSRNVPHLMTRLLGAFLDFLVYGICTAGLFFGCCAMFYGPMGYNDSVQKMDTLVRDSHLYIIDDVWYISLTDAYDTNKTPEENYLEPIYYYYQTQPFPQERHKLAEFELALGASGIYEKQDDGTWVRPNPDHELDARVWLTNQYNSALDFFYTNPAYIKEANHRTVVNYFNLLISEVVIGFVYYGVLPFTLKRNATPFKLVFKMGVVTKLDDQKPKAVMLLFRQLSFLLINILIPTFGIFFFKGFGYLALILIMVDIGFAAFAPSNASLHDFIGKTYVKSFRRQKTE